MEFDDLQKAARAMDMCGYYDALPWPSPAAEAIGQILNISAQHTARRNMQDLPRIDYMLSYTRVLQASDPRDKIYALLGLLSRAYAQHVPPNYAKPVSHAYLAAVKASILVDKCLDILSQVERVRGTVGDLPSWIPDWRQPTHAFGVYLGTRPFSGIKRYTASGNSQPRIKQSQDVNCIILQGIMFKQINRVIQFDVDIGLLDSDVTASSRKSWQDVYERKGREIPSSCARAVRHSSLVPLSFPTASDPRQDTIQRTVTRDIYSRLRSTKELDDNFPAYALWINTPQSDIPLQVLQEHDRYVGQVMLNRNLFIAGDKNDAYLGMASVEVRSGDYVCVLLGGDVPFILRPLHGTSTTQTARTWQFIGESYVHGIMDGEFMSCTSESDHDLEDFLLV
jgi:hypothetical protein